MVHTWLHQGFCLALLRRTLHFSWLYWESFWNVILLEIMNEHVLNVNIKRKIWKLNIVHFSMTNYWNVSFDPQLMLVTDTQLGILWTLGLIGNLICQIMFITLSGMYAEEFFNRWIFCILCLFLLMTTIPTSYYQLSNKNQSFFPLCIYI